MAKMSRNGTTYVRIQHGHSLIFWILLSCCGIGLPFLLYYSLSPNHYWHA